MSADAWSDLREGAIRKFCFVEIDLAGHSAIAANNSTRDAEATFSAFLDYIEEKANAHEGRAWGLAGDGGLFAFYDDDVTTMAEQATAAALDIVDHLDEFNATRSRVKQQVRVRIAVHLGDARYLKQTGRIQSDDINFVAHLEKGATKPDSVSVSANVYRELVQEEMRNRFRDNGTFEGRSVYTSAPPEEEAKPAAPAPEPEPPPPEQPDLPLQPVEVKDRYAVIVGISAYMDDAIPNLKYAAEDAQAVYSALVRHGGYSEENIKLLLNEQATYREIKSALGTFLPRSAQKDDAVFIYFAGHGCPDVDHSGDNPEDQITKYLAPYDAHRDDLFSTAFPMDELSAMLKRIESQYVVMALDTCYSGQAGQGRTFETVNTRAVLSNSFLNRIAGQGRVVITASDINELSMELEALGHGIFTHHLVTGMKGEADLDGDGLVSVQELYDYLSERVTKDAMSAGGRQHPLFRGSLPGKLPLTTVQEQVKEPEPPPVDPVTRDLEEALRLQGLGQHDEAIDLLSRALPGAGARIPEVRRALGKTRLIKGDLDGALEEYRAAIDADPMSAVGYADYSAALMKAGDHTAAIDALRRAVKIDPALRDQSVLIEMDLEAKVRENPADWRLRLALASVLALQGAADAALEQIRRAVDAAHDDDLETLSGDFTENPAFVDLRATPAAAEVQSLLSGRQEALAGFRACMEEGERLRKGGKLAAARGRYLQAAEQWPRYREALVKRAAEVTAAEASLKRANLERLIKEPFLGEFVEQTLSVRDRAKLQAGEGPKALSMDRARLEKALGAAGFLPIDLDQAFKLFQMRYAAQAEQTIAELVERTRRLIAADFLDRAQETTDLILAIDPAHAMGKALAQRVSDIKRQQAETAKLLSMADMLIREHEYEKAVALLRSQASLLSGKGEYPQLLKTAEEGRTREAAVKSFFTLAGQKESQEKWLESFGILTQIRLAQPDDPRVQKRYQETRRRVREWEQEHARKTPENMVFVPSGYFLMGDGLPVFVDGFYVDRHPVTNRQYREFLAHLEKTQDHSRCHPDEPRKKPHLPSAWGDPKWSGDDLPVVGIDWFDAYAYAAWAGKRLPYEAEWEKAASWKDEEEVKLLYPWGNEFDPARCNSAEGGIGRTTPVDRYAKGLSPYGALDMCGNAWEWCLEWFSDLTVRKRLITNPKGPAYGEGHVLRGGSWGDDRRGVTTRQRSRAYPLSAFPTVGFRCIRAVA